MILSLTRDFAARRPPCPRRALAAGWFSLLLLALPGAGPVSPSARALTVETRDFEGLVGQAETIFHGTVVAQESLWRGEGAERHLVTQVTFQVSETYKGMAVPRQALEFLGGTREGRTLRVPGVPRFAVGESAILFVVGNGAQVCPLVGAFQGHFAVERDLASAETRVYGHDHRPVTDPAAIGRGGAPTVSSDRSGSLTPRSRSDEARPTASPTLTAAEFGAAITRKLQERRARGLPEVQAD